MHLELDFQRWGRLLSSHGNSRSSQKKQLCYQIPPSSAILSLGKEEQGEEETFSLQPPLFSSCTIFGCLLFCYSKTKREPTVTATSRKKRLVLLNKNLLLLKQERKHCPNGSRSPSWQPELVLRHTCTGQSPIQPLPYSSQWFDWTSFLFPSAANILNTRKLQHHKTRVNIGMLMVRVR